jgi:hypothetical protein
MAVFKCPGTINSLALTSTMMHMVDGLDPKLIVSVKHVPHVANHLINPSNGTKEAIQICEVEKMHQHRPGNTEDTTVTATAINPAEPFRVNK